MFAWRAKWGYQDNSYTYPEQYLNTIKWTDETFFAIPQVLNLNADTSDSFYSSANAQYIHPIAANDILSAMGDDYYFISFMMMNGNNVSYLISEFKNLFASIETIAPNLYKLALVNEIIGNCVCYIPALKRYLFSVRSTSRNVIVVDENGTRLANDVSLSMYNNSTPGGFFVYTGPVDKESIIKASNWKGLFTNYRNYYVSSSTDRSDISAVIYNLFSNYSPPDYDPTIPPNPYEPGGPSGPSDLPPGTFDDTSDPIPDSSLPTLSAANTGFTRIYNPTLAQIQELANYLWTDETVIQTIWNKIKQYFEDPMQAIIGFNLVPVPVPNGGTEEFKLMYIPTGVQMTVAANQFVDVDCGTVKLERYYGSALDQSPYTKVSCFLPYIGTVHLDTDEVMGTELQVKYRVDICSGSCVAKIFVDGNVLYQYSGHCAITVPISSADFSNYVSTAIGVAQLAVGQIAGSAANIQSETQNAAQQTNQVVTTTRTTTTTERNPLTGRQITTGTKSMVQTREIPADTSSTQASFDALSPRNVANTVGAIMSSKPTIEHSGNFSGNSGYLGVRRPFLIIERPNMCMPEQYQHFNGFPAMITMELSTCKGFTIVQQVQLTGLSATNPEQAEILGLLKSGVFF